LDNGAIFASGEGSVLNAPVMSVSTVFVAAENKQAFQNAWNKVKRIPEEFAKPSVVKSAWRLGGADEGREEFIFFCGWPSVNRHMEFAKAEGFPKYAEAIVPLVVGREVKHYRRIL
jgi:DNA primase catalytic subunit